MVQFNSMLKLITLTSVIVGSTTARAISPMNANGNSVDLGRRHGGMEAKGSFNIGKKAHGREPKPAHSKYEDHDDSEYNGSGSGYSGDNDSEYNGSGSGYSDNESNTYPSASFNMGSDTGFKVNPSINFPGLRVNAPSFGFNLEDIKPDFHVGGGLGKSSFNLGMGPSHEEASGY